MDEQQSGNNTRRVGARTKNTILPLAADMGRIPPHATDLEQAVLGAMMLEKNAVTDTIDMLSTESFYDPKHQYIYGAIRELFGTSNPIDLLTVTHKLKDKANWKWPVVPFTFHRSRNGLLRRRTLNTTRGLFLKNTFNVRSSACVRKLYAMRTKKRPTCLNC